jgi:hypothetical protein
MPNAREIPLGVFRLLAEEGLKVAGERSIIAVTSLCLRQFFPGYAIINVTWISRFSYKLHIFIFSKENYINSAYFGEYVRRNWIDRLVGGMLGRQCIIQSIFSENE